MAAQGRQLVLAGSDRLAQMLAGWAEGSGTRAQQDAGRWAQRGAGRWAQQGAGRWALVEETGRDAGSSGWQVSRQLGALGRQTCGSDWKTCDSHGRWLEDLGSPGARVGSKQASRLAGRPGRQAASRGCGMVRQQAGWSCELVRQVAAELGLRPWWSGDGVRTGKSR